MTTTAEPLADAGPCRWCTDVQWDHKRGKGGCKVPGCGCDKYLPPKEPATPEPVDEPAAEPQRAADPSLSFLEAAALDRADQLDARAAKAEQERDDALEDRDDARRRSAEAHRLMTETALRLEQTARERDEALEARDVLRQQLDQARTEHEATVARLAADLARANASQLRAQRHLDEAIRASVTAATHVLWRYDARQCETCGRRYTADVVDHEHPLTPVTVLIVRRQLTTDTKEHE